jgi:1-acyl-sn-glycerol-3-phosphate acyltransferase
MEVTHEVEREKMVFGMLKPVDATLGLSLATLKKLALYPPFKQNLYDIVRRALRHNFEHLNDLDVQGLDHVPSSGGVILASNHQSWLDVQVLVASCPRHVHFLAKEMFRTWPVLRHLIELSDSIFVRRGGDRDALAETVQRLREGWVVAVYPEGTIPGEEDKPRSLVEPETGLLRGKTGAVRLAMAAEVPIVPVGVSGTGRSFPPETYPRLELLRPPQPTPITIRFGEPIRYDDHDPQHTDRRTVRQLTNALMGRISALVDHQRGFVPMSVPRPAFPTHENIGVLLLHGFTSSLKTVDGLAPRLEAQSIPYAMPVLRGHNTRYQDLRGVTAADWYEDAEKALDALYARDDVDKVVVIGLSMGGLVALELGMEHADKVAGVATVAAALRFKDPLVKLTPVLAKVFRYWPSPESFNDPSRRVLGENYPKFATDAFLSLYRYAQRIEDSLPSLRVPIRILQSKKDTVVAPVAANIIYENVSAEHREISWYMKSGHEMMQDLEAETVFDDLMDYVQKFQKDKPRD